MTLSLLNRQVVRNESNIRRLTLLNSSLFVTAVSAAISASRARYTELLTLHSPKTPVIYNTHNCRVLILGQQIGAIDPYGTRPDALDRNLHQNESLSSQPAQNSASSIHPFASDLETELLSGNW